MLTLKNAVSGAVLAMSISGSAMAHGHCDATALHEDMENLRTELKSLSFDLRSEDGSAAAGRVDSILAILKDAREETPFLFTQEGYEGAELESKMADYQSVMDDTIKVFMSVDDAIEAEDFGQAGSLLREAGNMRKKGHSAFKADC